MRVCFFIICPLEQGYSLHSISWVIFPYRCTNQTITYTYIMSCADPGILVSGGPCQSDKNKALATFFCSPQLILQKSKGQFQRNLSFFKVQEGVQHFPGGGGGGYQLFPGGGVQLRIPYRNPYNVWFSRGGGPDPLSPLWIRTCM